MKPSLGLLGLLLVIAPTVLAQDTSDLPDLTTASQTDGGTTTASPTNTDDAKSTDATQSTDTPQSTDEAKGSSALSNFPGLSSGTPSASADSTKSDSGTQTGAAIQLSDVPAIAGVGDQDVQVPNTAGAAFMQKSNLPDGTVFICVGAILAFFGAAVLAWRGLVAWSLHRSVKRAAMAQNVADMKAMTAVPGKKRGMYNVVGASSNMSLDRLSAAPTGTSRPLKPFASKPGGTPPRSTSSLFFSPTAGGGAGARDSIVNRSSTYLPAGYYAAGNAQAASGSPVTQVGANTGHLSTHSLQTPGNRFSHRSGISPPDSPSLPPSRGYDRAPPSRDGLSTYNRNSVATLGTPGSRGGLYGNEQNPSQLSLNVPGGNAAGGRAPSAYLEDLFESHGNGSRERL